MILRNGVLDTNTVRQGGNPPRTYSSSFALVKPVVEKTDQLGDGWRVGTRNEELIRKPNSKLMTNNLETGKTKLAT